MASLSTYFINDMNNLAADKNSVILGKKFRFTILTERLIRLEYSEQGIFEDRATSLVVNRKFSVPEFFVTHSETLMEVKTKDAIPLWMTQLLTDNHIYKKSFSKYGTAYTTKLREQLQKGKINYA